MTIHNTQEWRDARSAFIASRGNKCEICGRQEGDVIRVTDRSGRQRDIKISLSVHHKKRALTGLPLYRKVVSEMFREAVGPPLRRSSSPTWKRLEAKAREAVGYVATDRRVYNYAKKLWALENHDAIKAQYEKKKAEARQAYLSLTPDNAIVLCQRCHIAWEKGLKLCPVCRTYYYRPSPMYPDACYKCNTERRHK